MKLLKEFLDWVEMNYDVDFQHEALRHKQTRVVVNRKVPQEYKPPPKKGKASTKTLQYPMQRHIHARKAASTLARGAAMLLMRS